ncbi:uncharacterized protein LOC130914905 isoform X2 [Corythoichthys intestinalis]|uniref:uncharacterized protein LOC130914905 isoform X2 n=1 Tax=Corythoichthys intestinalis TaxID=161448 RepID=UPI0025A567E2|nr:uncharacterized protein LOC130914905 isoform X2 [Corythoichthys intestinalis]
MLFTLGLLLLTPFASLQTTNQKRNAIGNDLTKTSGAFTVSKPKTNSTNIRLTSQPTLNPNINQTILPTPLPDQKPPAINATASTRTKKHKHTASVNQTGLGRSTKALNDHSTSTRSATVNSTKTTKDKLFVNQTASEKLPLSNNGKIAKVKPALTEVQNVQSISIKLTGGTKTNRNKFIASINQTVVAKSPSAAEVKNYKERQTPTVQTPAKASTTNGSAAIKEKAIGSDHQTAAGKDLKNSKAKPTPTVQTATPAKDSAANASTSAKPWPTASADPTVVVKSISNGDMKNTKDNPQLTDQNVPDTSSAVKDSSLAAADMPHVNKTPNTKLKTVSAQPLKVVIGNDCESSNIKEHEVSLKPGTPLVMTHKISLMPGACAGSCESDMAELKGRLARLEREMSLLKDKCPCSANCPNDCSGNGECQKGKCICQEGFMGSDCRNCAQGAECHKKNKGMTKVNVNTKVQKVNKELTTIKENKPNTTKIVQQLQLEKKDQKKGTDAKETVSKSKLATATRLGLAKIQINPDVSEKKQAIKGSTKTTIPSVGQLLLKHQGRKHEEDRKGQTVVSGSKNIASMTKPYSKSDHLKDEPQANITQSDVTNLNGTAKRSNILNRNVATKITLARKHTKEQSMLTENNSTEPSESVQIKKIEVNTVTINSVDGKTGKQTDTANLPSVEDANKDATKSGQGRKLITDVRMFQKVASVVDDRNSDASKAVKGRDAATVHSVDGGNTDNSKTVKGRDSVKVHSADAKTEQGRHTTTVQTVDERNRDGSKTGKLRTTQTFYSKTGQGRHTGNIVDRKIQQGKHTTTTHYAIDRNTDTSETGKGKGKDTVSEHFVDGKSGQGSDTVQSSNRKTIQGIHTTAYSVDGKAEQGKHTKLVHSVDGKTGQGRHTTIMRSDVEKKTDASRIVKGSETITAHSIDGKIGQFIDTITRHNVGKTEQGRSTVHSGDGKISQGKHSATVHSVDTDAIKTDQGRFTTTVHKVDAKTGKGRDTSTVHSIDNTMRSQYRVNATLTANSDKSQVSQSQTTTHGSSMKTATRTGGLGSVKLVNISSHSFILSWSAPQGMFKNFTVIRREPQTDGSEYQELEEEFFEGHNTHITKNTMEVQVLKESASSSSKVVASRSKPETKRIMLVVPGNVRSVEFSNLRTSTRYVLHIYGIAADRRSKIHRVVATTGPEPAADMVFSNITETSLVVSWSKPKTTITGYMITYTHIVTGETHSVNLDTQQTHFVLSKLSAGSSYIVTVTTKQGRVQSDALVSIITTVPAPPTHLRAINVTDTRAVLQWTPSMGKVDRFIISYESSKTPNVTVTVMVSGNSVEHQLRGLQRGTVYTVKVLSQKDSLQSLAITTSFTTANVVKASEVGARSALIVWKSSTVVYHSYRLIYQVVGEEAMELILEPTITEYKLTGLLPMSRYNVLVEGERDGHYTSIVTTEFITGKLRFPYPTECSQELLNGALQSGEVNIYPQGKDGPVYRVYCDMETDGGGWTVFQRRINGKTDFYQTWSEYKAGFGNLSEEFWLGNEHLHNLTSIGPVSLRVDLKSGNETAYAHYANFSIDSEENNFALTVSGYTGTAGDSMRYHNGRPFSTRDKDPDSLGIHCSRAYMGGWWYKNCYKTNLNGLYGINTNNQGVIWIDWKGKDSSIPLTEMKFRPSRFSPATHG